MKFTFVIILVIAISGSFARAAEKDKEKAIAKPISIAKLDRKTPVDFEKEILPVLNASCIACHNKTKAKSGLVLETPADIRKGGDNGPAVVAGKPGDSRLIKSAAHSDANIEPMPPANNKVNAQNLTGEQLGLIALWIEQGATGEVKGTSAITWQSIPEVVQPVFAVAVTADGSLAAAGRGAGIDIYDLKEKKLLTRLADSALGKSGDKPVAHRDLVQSLAFSPDGKTLASGAYREVKLWTRSADSDSTAWKLEKTIGTGGGDSPITDRACALDFSPDGELLAIGSGVPSRTGQIALYSRKDGKIAKSLDEIHSDTVLALQFSADSKKLVSGSADKFVRMTDIQTGKVLHSYEGHTHHVLGVSLRKDGKVIASAGADNSLKFWDTESGERRKQSPAFEKEATCVHFIGDGDLALVCSGDAKVRTYRDNGSENKSFQGASDYMYACAASSDGKTIVAGGQDGVVRVWGADGKPATTFDK
jgi:WD40 repeat protein